jgi:hypothetical protein
MLQCSTEAQTFFEDAMARLRIYTDNAPEERLAALEATIERLSGIVSAMRDDTTGLMSENRRLLDDAYWLYQNHRRTMAWMTVSVASVELQGRLLAMLRVLRPMKAQGITKARFGTAHDGGYILLDDFLGISTTLSFGVENNADFDLAIADRVGCVLQFDHTIDKSPVSDPRLTWVRKKISAISSDTEESIVSIVDRLAKKENDLILKIDIEGDEWPLFDATPPEYINRFRQIVGEFHGFEWLHDPYYGGRIARVLEKLAKTHALVHVHANNYAGAANIAGILIPAVLEITFVNRSAYDLVETDETFPGPLDAPCDASRPDFILGAFRF